MRPLHCLSPRARTPRDGQNRKPGPHPGSDFDDFLKEHGIFEEVMSSPKIKKAIRDLGDSLQAGEREAFAAGWNAFPPFNL